MTSPIDNPAFGLLQALPLTPSTSYLLPPSGEALSVKRSTLSSFLCPADSLSRTVLRVDRDFHTASYIRHIIFGLRSRYRPEMTLPVELANLILFYSSALVFLLSPTVLKLVTIFHQCLLLESEIRRLVLVIWALWGTFSPLSRHLEALGGVRDRNWCHRSILWPPLCIVFSCEIVD